MKTMVNELAVVIFNWYINKNFILSNYMGLCKVCRFFIQPYKNKVCADFKSWVETIFVSKDNKQEYIEVDDFVRQGDYKYTYSDSSSTALKSEQADLVVSAAERFAQHIPLNMQEIFLWYFEQKGVDNPERFLGVNTVVNQAGVEGINTTLYTIPQGRGLFHNKCQTQTKIHNLKNICQNMEVKNAG